MNRVLLVVFFDEPFWVGVAERIEGNSLVASKTVFGAEPKDYEIYEFVLNHYFSLKFSPPLEAQMKEKAINPKRMIRQAAKQMSAKGAGTKSMQALQAQREQLKAERKLCSKEEREREKERIFQLKQKKRKQKHRGK